MHETIRPRAGRDVHVQWSSDGDDGRVKLIHVPLVGTERTMSAERLTAAAAERIPGLVDAREEDLFARSVGKRAPGPAPRDRPGMSLLLERGAPDEASYVFHRARLDRGLKG